MSFLLSGNRLGRPLAAPPGTPDERLAIQAEARRFAMEEVLPLANELDPQKAEIPRRFLDRMGEQGYFGITIAEEFGGMGLGVFEYCLITEELARAWMSVASIIARAQGMGTQVGDPDRRRQLLERSARGQWIGAASSGTDATIEQPVRRTSVRRCVAAGPPAGGLSDRG